MFDMAEISIIQICTITIFQKYWIGTKLAETEYTVYKELLNEIQKILKIGPL